jgi:hypothetical protein
MNKWTRGELDRFGAAAEIELAPVGRDGACESRSRSGSLASATISISAPRMGAAQPGSAPFSRATKVESRARGSKMT